MKRFIQMENAKIATVITKGLMVPVMPLGYVIAKMAYTPWAGTRAGMGINVTKVSAIVQIQKAYQGKIISYPFRLQLFI